MGQRKMELRQKVEADRTQGQEISEKGDKKIEEAEASRDSLKSIEIVDDDDAKAVEETRTESDAIAKGLAESEMRGPGERVSESLKETSEQSKEHSETTMQGSAKAAEMTADYSNVGSKLSSELQQSAQEFQEIADTADQTSEEMKSRLDQAAARLEGVF